MRPQGTAKLLQWRRQRAIALLDRGWSPKEVAQRVGADFSSVCRWRRAVEKRGATALESKPVPGRPKKLEKSACHRLLKILLKGALDYGFPNDLWTLKRISRVIRNEFDVQYHPNHVWRVLRRNRWSCQVPERRAIQRNDEALAHWKRYKWPHIKKSPKTWCPSGVSG
jgi:transposase